MLNVIEEEITQALDSLFSCIGSKTAAEIGEETLQAGEEDKSEGDNPDRIGTGLLGDVIIHKITEKQIGESFRVGGETLGSDRNEEEVLVTGHQTP